MKIGFVVDGEAEYRALPHLLQRIETKHILLQQPLYADIQPKSPVPKIVSAVRTRLDILRGRDAHKVIVLLDREDQSVCPGVWAQEITATLRQRCPEWPIDSLQVIVKDSCFENWLLADPSVFSNMPHRFALSPKNIASVVPNKADRANAQRILKEAVQGTDYDKKHDAVRILKQANISIMAQNSRSFRRLLRQVGHPPYSQQSLHPVKMSQRKT